MFLGVPKSMVVRLGWMTVSYGTVQLLRLLNNVILARILAPRLSERLGKPFVVENRAGAGTVLGADAVAKANPDGHTILMGTSTPLAINASLHKKLPYDPAKDFMPLNRAEA